MDEKIIKRQAKIKTKLLDNLTKIPIVQVACDKSGVSRSTYYRWRIEDKEFAEACDTALHAGRLLINDVAESQLMKLIKESNTTAIIFWLKNNDPRYSPNLELTTARTKNQLTDEQIDEVVGLLYRTETLEEGQRLLTSYMVQGLIPQNMATMILKMFITHLRATDILTRKIEADIMSKVVIKSKGNK